MTLHDRARKLVHEQSTLCDACYPNSTCENDTITIAEVVPIMVSLAREFAREALKQWVGIKYGEWWKNEGRVWRIVEDVPDAKCSSRCFNSEEDAKRRLESNIEAAIASAERGGGPET